ncbi:mitochondrial ribosome-associated GTPase-like protein [Sarcoptes scabiei]|uniref:Mitochondrial ribosome-associated GTPase-like protein n=1 Tax=Sarcoptes scabiei TaxID=52283 RepID=A0A132AFA1_SARSC|nr:mitochondrial ribosome-associated GTPase-like protein [Sarcoptes scabiei]
MKIIAHAGLIGFPNSGKSTLLSALSRAKPKVASYPFTTIKPNIGIIHYDDDEQLAIADLPGLIKGAHRNKGLGISFLRHIYRCVCLFYVIDISQQEPYEQFSVLVDELNQYNPNLSQRPIAIILNKIDSEKSDLKLERFRLKLQQNNLQHLKVIAVSGKFGINLKELLLYFRELYDRNNLNSIVEDSFD